MYPFISLPSIEESFFDRRLLVRCRSPAYAREHKLRMLHRDGYALSRKRISTTNLGADEIPKTTLAL